MPCTVAALSEEERIVEIRLESDQEKSILGNIYTGQVEKYRIQYPGGFCADRAWKEMLLFSCRGTESCFFPQEEKETDHCGLEMSSWYR